MRRWNFGAGPKWREANREGQPFVDDVDRHLAANAMSPIEQFTCIRVIRHIRVPDFDEPW
jgi:hypothetical protein